MGTVTIKLDQFNAGELAASLRGRSDLERYEKAAETMVNFLPQVQGPARRFWGSWLASAEIYGTARLAEMEYNSSSAFLFVFQHEKLLIYDRTGIHHQTLSAPWTDANLWSLDYERELDTTIIVEETMHPQRVLRGAGDVFILEDLTDTGNPSGVFITVYPTQDAMTRWVSSTIYPVGWLVQPNTGKENGDYYKCTTGGATGSSEPSWQASAPDEGDTVGDGTVVWTNAGTLASQAVWNETDGWPRVVTWFDDRLILGGTATDPNRWIASEAGAYFSFDTTKSIDDYAIDKVLFSSEKNVLQWIKGGRYLMAGTSGAEWSVIQDTPLTPNASAFREQTQTGSVRAKPVQVDGSLVHIARGGSQLRELLYSDQEFAIRSTGLSVLSPRAIMNATQLAALAAVKEDDANLVFCVSSDPASDTPDGYLGVMLTMREQDVLAFCRRTFEGSVESVAVLGGKVFVIVNYSFGPGLYADDTYEAGTYEGEGASSLRTLVYMDPENDPMVDLALTVTNTPADAVFAGYTHLRGSTVQVVADGFYLGEHVVSAVGEITLDGDYTTCTAGPALPTPTFSIMPVAYKDNRGNKDHAIKRIVSSLVEVRGSQQLVVNGEARPFLPADFDVTQPIPQTTGLVKTWHRGRARQPQLTITAPHPLRCVVGSITLEVSV